MKKCLGEEGWGVGGATRTKTLSYPIVVDVLWEVLVKESWVDSLSINSIEAPKGN